MSESEFDKGRLLRQEARHARELVQSAREELAEICQTSAITRAERAARRTKSLPNERQLNLIAAVEGSGAAGVVDAGATPPSLRVHGRHLAVTQILESEKDEIVAGELADPHLVERREQLLGRRTKQS